MLLDGRGRVLTQQLFDIDRDMHRLDAPERLKPLPFAPAQKHQRRNTSAETPAQKHQRRNTSAETPAQKHMV